MPSKRSTKDQWLWSRVMELTDAKMPELQEFDIVPELEEEK